MLDQMGVLKACDAIAMEALCECYGELIQARNKVAWRSLLSSDIGPDIGPSAPWRR